MRWVDAQDCKVKFIAAISKLAQVAVAEIEVLANMHASKADWGVATISTRASWQEAASGELAEVFGQANRKLCLATKDGRNRGESWYF
jgi:hypothetical protein